MEATAETLEDMDNLPTRTDSNHLKVANSNQDNGAVNNSQTNGEAREAREAKEINGASSQEVSGAANNHEHLPTLTEANSPRTSSAVKANSIRLRINGETSSQQTNGAGNSLRTHTEPNRTSTPSRKPNSVRWLTNYT